jgi:hypothetical protein
MYSITVQHRWLIVKGEPGPPIHREMFVLVIQQECQDFGVLEHVFRINIEMVMSF